MLKIIEKETIPQAHDIWLEHFLEKTKCPKCGQNLSHFDRKIWCENCNFKTKI
jgi:Zn finger protein HypA/HybF involved in hydrogenase expression